MQTLPSADFIELPEALRAIEILACVLDEQQAPLISLAHPGIMIDPQRMARLVRCFYSTQGSA